jgi:hypothetical protein
MLLQHVCWVAGASASIVATGRRSGPPPSLPKQAFFFLIKILLATGFAPLALAPYLSPTADTLFFNTYKWFFWSDIAYL